MADFRLDPAQDADQATVSRLIQLYLYDMAAETPFAVGANGQFGHDHLDAFWEQPYLFRVAGDIAGFALIIGHCPITDTAPCWFMAEYFVMRPYRRKQLGKVMLDAILARHPGRWHIATQTQNHTADAFWARRVPAKGRQEFSVRFDDANWTLRAFDCSGDPAPDRFC